MGTRCSKPTEVGGFVIQQSPLPTPPWSFPFSGSVIFFSEVPALQKYAQRERERVRENEWERIRENILAPLLPPPPPLAYLVEWPWKTKQVLSTFDFSAFKLILSAQLLKQLSSPAVSNFRLGTFTGCQVFWGCIVDPSVSTRENVSASPSPPEKYGGICIANCFEVATPLA